MNTHPPAIQDDDDERFNRLLWDATREYMDELHAVDHPKTRAVHHARARKDKTFFWWTARISKRATTTTPRATTPSATPSATTTTPSATTATPSALNIPVCNPSAERENIKSVMKTSNTKQSAYFSSIKKGVK